MLETDFENKLGGCVPRPLHASTVPTNLDMIVTNNTGTIMQLFLVQARYDSCGDTPGDGCSMLLFTACSFKAQESFMFKSLRLMKLRCPRSWILCMRIIEVIALRTQLSECVEGYRLHSDSDWHLQQQMSEPVEGL